DFATFRDFGGFMLVLAAVPDVQFHKLRRAAGSRFNVAQVSTWDDVLTSIRGRPVELAVVDPLLSGQARSQEIERLRVLFPSLPLMRSEEHTSELQSPDHLVCRLLLEKKTL